MKYHVSDVARILGLTPGALHFFESEGIINAKGYRQTFQRKSTSSNTFTSGLVPCLLPDFLFFAPDGKMTALHSLPCYHTIVTADSDFALFPGKVNNAEGD